MKLVRPVLFIIVATVLSGCVVPGKHLGAYRDAFTQARASGEEVLLDYGVALAENEKRAEAFRLANPEPVENSVRLAFDPSSVTKPPADAIVIRMKAWAVLGSYNEALVSVAEGTDPAKISGAVDGLINSIGTLSADLAADMVPFAGILKTVFGQVQRSMEVKHFGEAVTAAEPLIISLAGLLRDDTQNFYSVRLGLRNTDYSAQSDKIADLRDSIIDVLEEYTAEDANGDSQSSDVVERVNNALRRLLDYTEDDYIPENVSPGTTTYTSNVHKQQLLAAGQIEALVTKAVEIDNRLLAYREMVTNYVLLVNQMVATHTALLQAVENPKAGIPQPKEIVEKIIALRQSINKYRSER